MVDLDTFIQTQEVGGHRFGSRSATGANTRHPHTKLRELCGRRMYGKTRKGSTYYLCAPTKGYIPPGHPRPGAFFLREDIVIDRLNAFLSDHVFGAFRRQLLDGHVRSLDMAVQQVREQQVTERLGSVGPHVPNVDVAIVDDAGNAVPDGSPGEILARTPWRMDRYLTRAGGEPPFDARGYFRTGDVRRAAVFAVPDPRWGEAVLAVVHGENLDEETVLRWCSGHLGRYKQPQADRGATRPVAPDRRGQDRQTAAPNMVADDDAGRAPVSTPGLCFEDLRVGQEFGTAAP